MSVLEFSNNGLIDSLTRTPAPAIFLSELSREFAGTRRNKQSLTILSLRSSDPESITEHQIIAMSKSIQASLRQGEFFSRISEDGYWIALRGDSTSAKNLLMRILADNAHTQWSTSVTESAQYQSFNELISAIDKAHFPIS